MSGIGLEMFETCLKPCLTLVKTGLNLLGNCPKHVWNCLKRFHMLDVKHICVRILDVENNPSSNHLELFHILDVEKI